MPAFQYYKEGCYGHLGVCLCVDIWFLFLMGQYLGLLGCITVHENFSCFTSSPELGIY